MKPGHPHLLESIRARIMADGPVSFAWFMEQALYHPTWGYYSSGQAKLGRKGDYFTNASVGPVFGRLLAFQFNEIWDQMGRPREFPIIEQGAHHGDLAHDVLTALRNDSPECFAGVRYRIIEPFPILRERQAGVLSEFSRQTEWVASVEALEAFSGIHFSNELLDAMPVYLVRRSRGDQASLPNEYQSDWMERRVAWRDNEFVFVDRPATDPRLQERLRILPQLPAGFELEINLAALDWIDVLSPKLQRGYLLTSDYGYSRDQLAILRHPSGTLQCREQHRLIDSPFDCIGNCDITAHVDWTTTAERALERGFDLAGFTDQHHFLTGIISAHPQIADGNDPAARRQLQTLLHPEMMGRSFQVLALSRGITSGAILSGFKFARPPQHQLGIR